MPLLESTLQFSERNDLWLRLENVDRTSELVAGSAALPAVESIAGRVQAFTFGFDHEFGWIPHFKTAFGGQLVLHRVPASLTPVYGAHPFAALPFLRVRSSARE